MEKKFKWGILAPGKMSAKFTNGLKLLDNAELYAVGSRDKERARIFAEEFGFRKYYGTYEELAADKEVDVIYVASPHSHHHQHVMLCLENRKAVLCEKALALTSREAEEMLSKAKNSNVFLMEALWPPFQPYYIKAKEILTSGRLGRIVNMHAWFSFTPPYDPDDRKFNLSLGGGSLLDIGIYPVIDSLTFMGVPDSIRALATFGPTGSEESINAVFRYNNGSLTSLYSSFKTSSGIGCTLYCENGNMTVARGRDMNQHVILELNGEEKQEYSFSPDGMGYYFEAMEVMRLLDEGKTESKVVPHNFSLDLIKTLDRIRESAGIVFPGRD